MKSVLEKDQLVTTKSELKLYCGLHNWGSETFEILLGANPTKNGLGKKHRKSTKFVIGGYVQPPTVSTSVSIDRTHVDTDAGFRCSSLGIHNGGQGRIGRH